MAAASFLKRWARSIGLAFGTATLKTALYTVDGGQRAVIFDRYHGVLNDTFGEGSHLLIPGLQRAYILDARNAVEISISKLSVSKDHQIVNLTVSILSRPDVTRLPEIFKTLGLEYYEKILPSIGNEVLKTVLAQVYARELLTERLRVSALMRESLVRRAKDFNIEIVDVAITELSFGSEFSKVVEQTMVAEQEAEKSKFLVAKAELEMRAAIIRAEGESESAKIISDATAAFGSWLIELRKIEAAKDNAATFSKYGKVYMPRNNNMLLDLDFFEEGLLKKVMDVIKDLVNDVNFDCSATGFSLQAMDSSHVALVAMLLRSEGFKHYRFDSNDIMAKRLKCAGSDDIITIKAVVGSDTISFMFESLTQDKIADFEKKLMDINSEHLGIPKAEYHAIVRMPSSEFGRICEDLSSIGDTAVISVTKEGVKFSTRGDTGTANVVCKQNTTVDKPEEATVIEMNEPVSLTFALRYLNSFTKASPLSSTVTISLSSKLPVVVEYKIAEMGYIRFYLAPKIEEDGEETKP